MSTGQARRKPSRRRSLAFTVAYNVVRVRVITTGLGSKNEALDLQQLLGGMLEHGSHPLRSGHRHMYDRSAPSLLGSGHFPSEGYGRESGTILLLVSRVCSHRIYHEIPPRLRCDGNVLVHGPGPVVHILSGRWHGRRGYVTLVQSIEPPSDFPKTRGVRIVVQRSQGSS